MRDRAFRRREDEKARRRCARRLWWLDKGMIPYWYKNRVKCSCGMCGNPRRSPWVSTTERLTRQEVRAQEQSQSQLLELSLPPSEESKKQQSS